MRFRVIVPGILPIAEFRLFTDADMYAGWLRKKRGIYTKAYVLDRADNTAYPNSKEEPNGPTNTG